MKALFLAIAMALAITPVLAQSKAQRSQSSESRGAITTPTFVRMAAISDMFEIESSNLAQEKAASDDVRAFAAEMIAGHTKTTKELTALVSKENTVKLPQTLDEAHAKKLKQLQSLSGAAFDKQYQAMQVQAHRDAVKLFESYAKSGDDKALQQWAQKTLPELKMHLSMAQQLADGAKKR